MRMTLVGDHPPPYGGISIHVHQLHQFLLKNGVEAQVLDIGKGQAPSMGVVSVKSWVEYAWHVRRLQGSNELVHAHVSGNNPKAWAVAASLGSASAPRLLTVHSGLFPAFARLSFRWRLFVRAAASGFDRIIAVSSAVAHGLKECGVPDKKVSEIPPFLGSQVLPGELPVGFEPIRARRQPLLAYAHHPSPVYGRELMFRSLKFLSRAYPELGLLVFGPGTQDADFVRDSKAFGVEGLLEVLGEIPHGQALAAMSKSDAFVRPTLADGDSISVREALALGIPAVASNASVRPKGTVVFSRGDPRALCDAVVNALSIKPVRETPLDCGPSLLSLYEELLKGGDTHAIGQ